MKRIFLATAAVALSMAAVAEAQPRERGEGRGGRERGEQQQARPQQVQPQQARPEQGQRPQWNGERRQRPAQAQAQPQALPQAQPQQRPQPQQARPDGRRGDRSDAGRRDQRPDAWSGQRDNRPDARQQNRSGDRRNDNRGWDRDDRRFDNRGPARRDYGRYRNGRNQIWSAPNRFRAPVYRYPRGYTSFVWSFGSALPSAFWTDQYVLTDYWNYGLPMPYPGTMWVRMGRDALMIERGSGYVVEVARDLFW